MSSKTKFSSKIGVIAATVGSAVGLGTVWRFPNEVQANGGSVFLIAYLFAVLLMGIPVMLSEFSIGRGSGADTITSFKKLTPGKPWWLIGVFAVLAPYLILMYYLVVAGWTVEYLWLSLTGGLYEGMGASPTQHFSAVMQSATSSTWSPIIWTLVMIALNILILMKGVQKGIERMSNLLMPLLFVILLVFCCVSLSLPGAMEGVEFFLRPDFSKLNPGVLISAVGQAFFSLSLGMGILITYSSYFPKTTNLPRTATKVSALVFLVAVMMGLIIFPAVKAFGIEGETQGAALIFVTLPQIFMELPFPQFWSSLFFFLLLVATLTSTVSIAEVAIAYLCDTFHMSRRKSCLIVLLPMVLFSSVCSLSLGVLSDVRVFGLNIFDLIDYTTSNIMLPLVAFAVCIYVGYGLPKSFFFKELSNDGSLKSRMTAVYYFLIRYVSPLLLLTVFINKIIG